MIAARQIAAADRAGKQYVADDGETLRRIEVGDAAGGVAGTMQHRESERTDRNLVTVVEPAVRHDIAGAEHSESQPARRDMAEPKLLGAVRSLDGNPEFLPQLGGAAGVVDVAM